jgi:hypothetical protein
MSEVSADVASDGISDGPELHSFVVDGPELHSFIVDGALIHC